MIVWVGPWATIALFVLFRFTLGSACTLQDITWEFPFFVGAMPTRVATSLTDDLAALQDGARNKDMETLVVDATVIPAEVVNLTNNVAASEEQRFSPENEEVMLCDTKGVVLHM